MKKLLLSMMLALLGLQACDDEATNTGGEKTGSIEGTVVDQNNVPIRGVSLTTNPATTTATTDSLGKFKFPSVIPGTYSLTASKDGVQKSLSISVVSSLTTTANFIMTIIPSSGLVAYYPFQGNAKDGSGNNYNGIVNGALLTTDRFGNANSAYIFDGKDDYISCDNVAGSLLEPKEEFSISCFIKGETAHGKNRWSRILKKAAPFDNGYALSWDHELNGNLQMFLAYDNIPAQFYTPNDIATTSNDNLIGNWHHVAMTYSNSTKTMKLYVDGVLTETVENCSYKFQHSGDALWIGGAPSRVLNGTTYYETFPGSIDDVRIYNRTLTSDEIILLYHEGGF